MKIMQMHSSRHDFKPTGSCKLWRGQEALIPLKSHTAATVKSGFSHDRTGLAALRRDYSYFYRGKHCLSWLVNALSPFGVRLRLIAA
jgi:hypothetical protein